MDPGAAETLGDLGAMRDSILTRIVARARQDERVVAAWLTGSVGRGEDDAWSDLDLHLAIADDHLDAWWRARESLYREIAPPVFIQWEMPSNAQEGGRFQLVYFPGPVEVDWNVGPLSMASRPPASRMLFARQDIPVSRAWSIDADERRERLQRATDFFWAMTPIAVKYAGRGATTDAVDQLELLARGLTEVWRLLHDSPNLSLQNPLVEPELAAILPRMDPVIDPSRCLKAIVALMSAMNALRPQLEAAAVRWPSPLVSQVEAIVEVARDIIGSSDGDIR
jgi:hypothetical protein